MVVGEERSLKETAAILFGGRSSRTIGHQLRAGLDALADCPLQTKRPREPGCQLAVSDCY